MTAPVTPSSVLATFTTSAPLSLRSSVALAPAQRLDRFTGCLLGVGVGDALGRPAESRPAHVIRHRYGRITEMLADRRGDLGAVTDDTQLTILVAQCLGPEGFDPDKFARRIVEIWPTVRGGGRATRAAVERLSEGHPWHEAGSPSAGNGAAMRVAPVGLLRHRDPDGLVRDAALSCIPTHRDPTAIASSIAQAALIASLVDHRRDQCVDLDEIARIIGDVQAVCPHPPILERRPGGHPVRLTERLLEVLDWLDLPTKTVMKRTYNGALVNESLPASLWFALAFQDDPEQALVEAASAGRDADTVASMTGALLGALHGESAWPSRWTEPLEAARPLRGLAQDLAQSLERSDGGR